MAFVCNGSGHLVKSSGGAASITEHTLLLAVQRLSTQVDQKALLTLRPSSEATGHNVLLYNGGFGSDAAPVLRADYGTADADPNEILPEDTWQWVTIQGDSTTAWIRQLVAGSWVSASCAQTDWLATVDILRICDTGEGLQRLDAKIAHIREWDQFLTEAELTTETNSITPVITATLVSAKRGVAVDLATALTGETGTAFTTSGTVTLDSDEPTFTATAEITIAQTIADFTDAPTISAIDDVAVAQTIADFSQAVSLALDSLSVDITQTIADFTSTLELTNGEIVDITQTLADFVSVITVQGAGIAPPATPEYNSISCGPGSYGTPVNSAHRTLKREIHRPWPTR